MKIRNGFVSNSSTSSFCIFGCQIDKYDFMDVVKSKLNFTPSEDDDDSENIYEAAELFCKNVNGIEYHLIDGVDTIYLGRDLSSMDDNETFGLFKAHVRGELQEYFPDATFETLEEAYYS